MIVLNLGKCDQEVYECGQVVAELVSFKPDTIEGIVRDWRNIIHRRGHTSVRIDWYYAGGRAIVKVLASTQEELDIVRALLAN